MRNMLDKVIEEAGKIGVEVNCVLRLVYYESEGAGLERRLLESIRQPR